MNEKMLIKNLYDLDKTIAKPLLENSTILGRHFLKSKIL